MARLLQISQLGHLILREKAKPINDVRSKHVQELIDDMLATLEEVGGLGLAAPQVYESRQLFIIASHPTPNYPNAPEMAPTAIINPVVISRSEEKFLGWEGCLSIPGFRGLVPRHKTLQAEFLNRQGEKEKMEFNDFVSIIFQHEIDHLNGTVYLDRVENTKDIITEKEYQRLIKSEDPSISDIKKA